MLSRGRAGTAALRPAPGDVALALGFAVAGQVTAWTATASAGPKPITVPVALVVAGALAWRRTGPLGFLVVVMAAVAVQQLVAPSSPAIFYLVVLLFSVFSAAAHLPSRRAALAGVLGVAGTEVVTLLDPTSTGSDKLLTAPVLISLPWLAGRALRRQRAQALELKGVSDRLRVERDERAQAAVAAERVRIARDLHDVIAHSVSVMIVQAGAAEQVLDRDPGLAREPLHAIRSTGKAALLDMRRLLGVLRTDADGVGLAPQPTLGELAELAGRFSAAGLTVDLDVSGEAASLAPGIEMTAYRVCQEALTNALKHGGGHAQLRLRCSAEAVEIAVLDDGDGRPAPETISGGHGLAGMRERVALYGGELQGGAAARGRLRGARPPALRTRAGVIRVLLADDQALVRGGFRMILEAQPDLEVCGEAADGAQAVALAHETRPDVVLMDIRMPVLDGIQATRRLLDGAGRVGPVPHVLILTTFDLDEYVYDAMKAGASGFLLKDVDPPELAHAVRVVAGGEALLAPAITRRLVERFVRRPPPGSARPARLDELTERELEVLRLIARCLSNAEIAAELFLTPATVKTHVARILQKLDLRDRVQAVALAYETGLVEPVG